MDSNHQAQKDNRIDQQPADLPWPLSLPTSSLLSHICSPCWALTRLPRKGAAQCPPWKGYGVLQVLSHKGTRIHFPCKRLLSLHSQYHLLSCSSWGCCPHLLASVSQLPHCQPSAPTDITTILLNPHEPLPAPGSFPTQQHPAWQHLSWKVPPYNCLPYFLSSSGI